MRSSHRLDGLSKPASSYSRKVVFKEKRVKRRSYDPELDLFVPYVADLGIRDQRETMERPFFSLGKRKRLKAIEYRSPDGGTFVTVLPHQDFGMATIWDADVLIWAASTLNDLKRRGVNDLPRTLSFQPYDLLRGIGRQTGGNRYKALRDALGRLQTTTITTNIRAGKGRKSRQFSWIDAWSDLTDEDGTTSRGMTVTLSEWFYEGVVMDGGVLSIDFDYFAITGGRERWLYRVARKHAGGAGKDGFAIALPTLFEKAGAEGTYRRFKHEITKIAKTSGLPGYDLSLITEGEQPCLVMRRQGTDGPIETVVEPLGPPYAPMLPLGRHLTDETLELIRQKFPGWDVYALQSEFDAWISSSPEDREPRDYQRAFYGFVRRRSGERS